MAIQWFPGHMAKAKREAEANLSLVDFVIELVDARTPLSSQNPLLQDISQHKPKMMVLMKQDLADESYTTEWLDYFNNERGITALAIDVNNTKDIQQVIRTGQTLGQAQLETLKQKGAVPRLPRAMILGIPNVGKSTLINRLANKKLTQIGGKPGVTKKQQWIKVKHEFELLDTPGILWPKFEDEAAGYKLAAVGTIKDDLLPLEDVAAFTIQYLQAHFPEQLEKRYGITQDTEDMEEIFKTIGKKRGALESGGHVNFEKVASMLIQDLRSGKLGRITFETPN